MTQGPTGSGGAVTAPPLGVVTGTVPPGEVYGGFGPAGAFQWRGACVGGCGGRPGCRADEPAPECSGCARKRHGITDGARTPWRPTVSLATPAAGATPARQQTPVPERWAVLRRATEVNPDDPALPRTVLRTLAAAARVPLRVFVAVAADAAGTVVASVSVRAPGVGYVVYERAEGGTWRFARGAVLAPRPRHRLPARLHLMRANVSRFTAALQGVEHEPPAAVEPPAPSPRGTCPGCGADVALTKAGAVYASHKCRSRAVEGRS